MEEGDVREAFEPVRSQLVDALDTHEDTSRDEAIQFIFTRARQSGFTIKTTLQSLNLVKQPSWFDNEDTTLLERFLFIERHQSFPAPICAEVALGKMIPYFMRVLMRFMIPNTVFFKIVELGAKNPQSDDDRMFSEKPFMIPTDFNRICMHIVRLCLIKAIQMRSIITAQTEFRQGTAGLVPTGKGTIVRQTIAPDMATRIGYIYEESRNVVKPLFDRVGLLFEPPDIMKDDTLWKEITIRAQDPQFVQAKSVLTQNPWTIRMENGQTLDIQLFLKQFSSDFDSWFISRKMFTVGPFPVAFKPERIPFLRKLYYRKLESLFYRRPSKTAQSLLEAATVSGISVKSVLSEAKVVDGEIDPRREKNAVVTKIEKYFGIDGVSKGAIYAMSLEKFRSRDTVPTGFENLESMFMEMTGFLVDILLNFAHPESQPFAGLEQDVFRLCLLRAVGIRASLALKPYEFSAKVMLAVNRAYKTALEKLRPKLSAELKVGVLQVGPPNPERPWLNPWETKSIVSPGVALQRVEFVRTVTLNDFRIHTTIFHEMPQEDVALLNFWFPPLSPFPTMEIKTIADTDVDILISDVYEAWERRDIILKSQKDERKTEESAAKRFALDRSNARYARSHLRLFL